MVLVDITMLMKGKNIMTTTVTVKDGCTGPMKSYFDGSEWFKADGWGMRWWWY